MEPTTTGGISTPTDRDLAMRPDGRRATLHVGVAGFSSGIDGGERAFADPHDRDPAADGELRSALAAAPPSTTSRQRG